MFLSDTKFRTADGDQLIDQTRKTYAGPLVVGQDLMPFVNGDDGSVRPAP